MNKLQLVNRLRQECGIRSPALLTLQTGLSAQSQEFVNWIDEAWEEVQLARPNWQWMHKELSFQTVAAQGAYTPTEMGAPDLKHYRRKSFKVYLTASGRSSEQFMSDYSYPVYRDSFLFGSIATVQGYPMHVTVQPDKSLAMNPIPNAVYTITGEYYRKPTTMTADDDAPDDAGNDLPDEFHLLLVFVAMRKYATFEAAPEVEARGMKGETKKMAELEVWGLPSIGAAPALA